MDKHGDIGGLTGNIRDKSKATVARATTQFHWQDPSHSTESSRQENPSACFSVLVIAGSSPGWTSYPTSWKTKFVTPIPKAPHPQSANDLRNISCTMLTSKVNESFLLNWLNVQTGLRGNQYGGVKGSGSEHLLVRMCQDVLQALEDPRAAVLLTSIDFAKAFNRLDFNHCLTTLRDKGASNHALKVVASFLTNRKMMVKIGSTFSKPRGVLGVCHKVRYWGYSSSTAASTPLKQPLMMSTMTKGVQARPRLSLGDPTQSLYRLNLQLLTTDICLPSSDWPWKSTNMWTTMSFLKSSISTRFCLTGGSLGPNGPLGHRTPSAASCTKPLHRV